MMTNLRPYQIDAVAAVFAAWERGSCCPLVSLPTGTGKSLVAAEIVRSLAQGNPEVRVVVVTHVKELIAQNEAALKRLWPQAQTGVHCAGLGRKDTKAQIIFGSVQSLFRKPEVIGRRHVVLIDEAHLVPYGTETGYRTLIAKLRDMEPGLVIAGLSATPFRLSSGLLTAAHKGVEPLFSEVCYEAGLADMVAQGWLSPLTAKATGERLAVAGVHTLGGEFKAGELEDAVNRPERNVPIVDEIVRRGADRKSWLVFCAGVAHVRSITALMRMRGVSCDAIMGDTELGLRDKLIAQFKAGGLRCLVSCGVLTTGFDAPAVDLIAALRPTKSPGLWLQMLGRGMRLAPGKTDCLIMDFAGNVKRLGPASEIDGSTCAVENEFSEHDERSKHRSTAKVRECPVCNELLAARTTECPECDFVFPVREVTLDTEAAVRDVLVDPTSRWFDVKGGGYKLHTGSSGKTTLRVSYEVGLPRPISEFQAFESEAARPYVERWWREAGGGFDVPATALEAIRRVRELVAPRAVRARVDGQFWKVTARRYEIARAVA